MSSAMSIISWCPGGLCDPCGCPWARYTDTSSFMYLTGYPAWSATASYVPGDHVNYLEQPFRAVSPVVGANPAMGAILGQWTLLSTSSMPLDQATMCSPYWGVAGIAVGSGHVRGDIVNGYIDVSISGSWANLGSDTLPTSPPALPPAVHVVYQASDVFTFDPSSGTIINFVATGDNIDAATGGISFIVGAGVGLIEGFGVGGVAIYGGAWSATARITIPGCIFLDSASDHIIAPYNCVLPYTGPIPNPSTLDQVTPSSDTSAVGPTNFCAMYTNVVDPLVWLPRGVNMHLAQAAAFFSPYYLHAK